MKRAYAMLRRLPILLAVAVAALLGPALAGDAQASPRQVERALSLYQAGQLTRALTAFERALAATDNVDADMPTIYRHLGELRAGSGDAAGAEEAFRKLLELDPAVVPSPDWSPVVLEPFERARAAVRGTNGGQQGGGQQGGGGEQADGGQQGGGGQQAGGGQQGGGGPPPPPIVPPPRTDFGGLGPALDTSVWTAPGEPEGTGVLGSAWFWGGVTAFVAAAVAVAIVTVSSSGEPYLAIDGSGQ